MNYTFAELLHVFFALHTNKAIRTYSELSSAIGVSRRTINAWFAAEYPPRSKEQVLRIAEELLLTPQQTDLLLYSVKPSWVAYGTPPEVLEHIQLFRSSCFSPKTFCLTAQVRMPDAGNDDEGAALVFEEISDNCFALFRLRPYTQQASVVQTFEGRNHHHIYINRASVPAIKKDEANTLAIVCIDENFWFYVNGTPVQRARTHIPRLSRSRLDVAVVAGAFRTVSVAWSHFCVRTPRPPSVDLDP